MKSHDHYEHAVIAYVTFFERLERGNLGELGRLLAPNVHFKDPFNDVRGRDAVRNIFEHMFDTAEAPRFHVDDWMCRDAAASIRWRFQCEVENLSIAFQGMSYVRFNERGEVMEHIDYWDPAEGIYERVPLLGWLMRNLRRRFVTAKVK